MNDLVLYIHGKDGSASECEHYQPLFPDCVVFGLDYQTFTPWETGQEIHRAVEELKEKYDHIVLIANSIGAFFCMNAGIGSMIRKAYFISPIVDMEKLIGEMMQWADVTEAELKSKGVIRTGFGEDLSWDYLCYVRCHSLCWDVPTRILYGRKDNMTSFETMRAFAEKHNAALTVMENGEHWFHTDEQMQFLDNWIQKPDVILLNGPSSAGKSSIAKQLQRKLCGCGTGPVVISLDDYLQMSAEEAIWEDDVFEIMPRMCRDISAALQEGRTLIVDHVMTSPRICSALLDAAAGFQMKKVLVTCPVELLRKRESGRGDRFAGSAEASLQYLFPKDGYDLVVDTGVKSPSENAMLICSAFF